MIQFADVLRISLRGTDLKRLQMNNSTHAVKPKYVPEGHVFPPNFPEWMFKPGSDYPVWDPDAQQWTYMVGPNGEPTYHNERMGFWITFGMFHETKPDGTEVTYRIPLQHERGGGGATILPFQLVFAEDGETVIDIRIAFWAKRRKTIVSDPSFMDFEAMGGFREKSEPRAITARREHHEESGITAGEEFEVSMRRGCINRAINFLGSENEGVSTFAYLATEEQFEEFEASGDHPVMSWLEAVMSRCEITKASVLDLVVWVKRTYKTAL